MIKQTLSIAGTIYKIIELCGAPGCNNAVRSW